MTKKSGGIIHGKLVYRTQTPEELEPVAESDVIHIFVKLTNQFTLAKTACRKAGSLSRAIMGGCLSGKRGNMYKDGRECVYNLSGGRARGTRGGCPPRDLLYFKSQLDAALYGDLSG